MAILTLANLKSEDFRVRAATISALEQWGPQFIPPLTPMLADPYPQVRGAALAALEKLQPSGEWRAQLKYECYIPAGAFIMGDDRGPHGDEKPAHEVFVPAFYIGKYPVTNAEYKNYLLAEKGYVFDITAGLEKHPVAGITWQDARDYAAWAGWRLLTEAEWEKAASWEETNLPKNVMGWGGKTKRKRSYPWGNKFEKNKANTKETGLGLTTPVGQYSPEGDSPYGCADMAGNVWEWTSTLWRGYPYKSTDGREAPATPGNHVVRGGSFINEAALAGCVYRDDNLPNSGWYNYGFRIGLSASSA